MTVENKNSTSITLPAVALAVFAAVLIIAFLANRGSDIGQIGKFFENLGGGPLGGSGIVDSFVGVVVAILIAAAWFGIGSFVLSFIETERSEDHSHALELALKTGAGAAVWSVLWFFLGIAGAYSKAVGAAALIVGLAFVVLALRRVKEAKAESRMPERAAVFDKIVLVLISVPVVLSFIAALAPPTAKDTLLYHFAVPKAFIAQGSSAFIEGNIASYLALGNEMHVVWAMLLGGFVNARAAEAAAGAAMWMFFPILLAAVFGWAREIGISRRWSLIAVLMVASVPTAYHVAASAYIDLALALYVTLAVYALSRWWRTLENAWLILIAIFLGAALSAKLTSVVVIAAFGLIVLLRVRKAKEIEPSAVGKILVSGFAALVLAGVIASPWYLRTWAETGSPVFPFYMNIWPGEAPGWDKERSNLFQAMNSQYGRVTGTAADQLLAPWNVSVKAQPEEARFFDGVLGVTFLIGLPILIFALWKFDLPVEVRIGAGVAAVVFLFWLFSSMQLRYLLPILPLLAIGIAASVEQIAARRSALYMAAKYSISIAAICGILTAFAWFLQKAPLRVVLGGETRDQYLTRNLDYYSFYQALNTTTAKDARVWLINMRRDTYNLDRPVVSDYLFEDWTLRQMLWESRSVQELKAKAAAMNLQYMLTRYDFLFDYDRSTLVDDTKPRAENEAKLKIAKELILDRANTVHSDGKFSLVKLF
ncbi:MAG: phospholipid carrier-dependent glycosyltransferase [Acidobacteria bacterium]|nr:phospholipid carrier-dependent glycosyltransferase [Acidobacteriota bacterium]